MNSFLTNDTKAIILLCGVLGKDRSIQPLSQSEYNALARWLVREKLRPESLLSMNKLRDAAVGAGIEHDRLEKLLDRGVQLGFAVEEWQRSGLWVISRSDAEYPARYKNHLREKAPPILFGAGDKSLLHGGGVAIVGSRNVDAAGEAFTCEAAEECARNCMMVVSGGARGVDQVAMRAAIEAGGRAIGVLAENLLKASIERDVRYAIADGRMLLISPYHPHARFTVGSAMGRNKLIYAMADYGLVVSADHKKGGTWAGAEEELKRDQHVPVFVRVGEGVPVGNKKLLGLGALEWPTSTKSGGLLQRLREFAGGMQSESKRGESANLCLFDSPLGNVEDVCKKLQQEEGSPDATFECSAEKVQVPSSKGSIYQLVLPVILSHLNHPVSVERLSVLLEVSTTQLDLWLKKASDDGLIEKHKNPVMYSAKKRL